MNKNLVFDVETDGLDPTEIFCIVTYDVDTGITQTFAPSELDEAYRLLLNCDKLIGHNIGNYDIPVVKKLAGVDLSEKRIIDTLILSRLFNPTRAENHSLKSWGYRLNFPKTEFDEFDSYTPEMLEYCKNDVLLNYKVYEALRKESRGFSIDSINLEHKVSKLLREQEETGFLFDQRAGMLLLAELNEKVEAIVTEVHKVFRPKRIETKVYPKRTKSGAYGKLGETMEGKQVRLTEDERKRMMSSGYITLVKVIDFNLGSRKQIGEYLQEFGWKPKDFTPTGQPIIDEPTLKKIKGIPAALLIAEYLMLQKRVSQINSWFKELAEDGRVHGYVNHNGTITGRMTHRNPNMAQIPSSNAPYGKECRACWIVPAKHKLVGIDASGLELRMLAHYLEDEDFTNEILHGDIHTSNQKNAGLESRNQAKTFIYALIYGAGDGKLGSVVGGSNKEGRRLRDTFLNNLPTFKSLIKRVERAAAKGYIKGLDGRKIIIRSAHSALNALLQGAGAIAMKQALVIFSESIKPYNAKIVGNIHDEWQVEVPEEHADTVGKLGVEAIIAAGLHFEMRCPLDGEYSIGDNWSETH
jgi:DNA polymerase I